MDALKFHKSQFSIFSINTKLQSAETLPYLYDLCSLESTHSVHTLFLLIGGQGGAGSQFSVITKNLNCEILTTNLVTFKRWDGVKDEEC